MDDGIKYAEEKLSQLGKIISEFKTSNNNDAKEEVKKEIELLEQELFKKLQEMRENMSQDEIKK